jgi:hypothetical protein
MRYIPQARGFGMLVRLLITGGILVANGVLLVLVLRVLTLVVIRRVHPSAAPAAEPYTRVVRSQATPATAVVEPRPMPDAPAPAPTTSAPVATAAAASRPGRPRNRYRIHHHRMLLGVPALAVIFAAGAWLGDWVGNGGSTAAAATQTVHLKGKVIYTPGSTVQVQVPGTTLTISGKVVTVPSTVIIPGANGVSVETLQVPTTINHRVTVPTTIVTTVTVPTTLTQTDTSTVSLTETVTDTTTVTQTDTTTVSQTATT